MMNAPQRPFPAWIGILLFTALSLDARENDAAGLTAAVDRGVDVRIEAEKLRRTPQADDAEFLRRITLDLHGVVPSADETVRFLDSRDPEKRAELIEKLLAAPRFGRHFGNLWRGRLLSPLVADERQRTERFTEWLAKRFNDNDGWDRIVRDLVTAGGKLEDNPSVAYLIEGRFPLSVTDLTDLTSRYFLGIRMNCAQCHDHPFAEWKRKDYWSLAAFFTQIQTPGRSKMVYVAGIQDNPKLTLASLAGGDMLEGYLNQAPVFPGGTAAEANSKQTLREALAGWMTSAENPFFARAAVNRMWQHFFGRGLVDPVDDMHSGNAPSHPELLELLSRRFVESGFDLKLLCRAIANSRTYQQTSRPGDQADAEAKWFARASIRVLSAEQLYDSLEAILGPPGKTSGIDARLGTRHEFTQFFATDSDSDPTRYERGIPHVLRLMNSSQFAGHNVTTLVARASAPDRTADQIVEQLFLSVLSRRPTPAEVETAREHFRGGEQTPQKAHRDLAWALLMSGEFSLNH